MEISVVIPTYNRIGVLPRAIDSVLAQTFPAKEILVIDDGSNDETASIIGESYPQIRLIRQNNLGVSAARNSGIREAQCEWIALLDSDDEWRPEKLMKQARAPGLSTQFQVCHTDEIWIRRGLRVNPMKKHAKPDGWIFSQCLPLCCVSPSSVMIHSDVFQQAGVFDEELPVCEDYDMWLRIFSRYPVLLVAENLLCKYGGHDDQLSRKLWGMDRFRVKALVNLLEADTLNAEQESQTREMLIGKIEILMNGFRKRQNYEEWHRYHKLKMKWSES